MSQSSSEQYYSMPSQSKSPDLSDFTEEETLEDTLPHEDQLQQFAHPRVVASPRSMIQRPHGRADRAHLSAPAVAITDPLAVRAEPLLPGYGCNTRCGSDVLRNVPLGVDPGPPNSGRLALNITQNHIRQAMYACTPWRVVRRNAHGAAEEAGDAGITNLGAGTFGKVFRADIAKKNAAGAFTDIYNAAIKGSIIRENKLNDFFEECRIVHKAAALGIGPHMYGHFCCRAADTTQPRRSGPPVVSRWWLCGFIMKGYAEKASNAFWRHDPNLNITINEKKNILRDILALITAASTNNLFCSDVKLANYVVDYQDGYELADDRATDRIFVRKIDFGTEYCRQTLPPSFTSLHARVLGIVDANRNANDNAYPYRQLPRRVHPAKMAVFRKLLQQTSPDHPQRTESFLKDIYANIVKILFMLGTLQRLEENRAALAGARPQWFQDSEKAIWLVFLEQPLIAQICNPAGTMTAINDIMLEAILSVISHAKALFRTTMHYTRTNIDVAEAQLESQWYQALDAQTDPDQTLPQLDTWAEPRLPNVRRKLYYDKLLELCRPEEIRVATIEQNIRRRRHRGFLGKMFKRGGRRRTRRRRRKRKTKRRRRKRKTRRKR